MKLLLCKKCRDIIKLQYYKRYCNCGSCSGKYINEIQVQVEGHNAVVLGIDNADIRKLAQDKVGKFEIFKIVDKERIINLSENKVDFRNTKLGDDPIPNLRYSYKIYNSKIKLLKGLLK